MDRNTLIVLVLVGAILLLLPTYWDLIYPEESLPVSTEKESVVPHKEEKVSADLSSVKKEKPFTTKEKEVLIKIQTPLFSAVVSNKNGGSFTYFELNNYALNDSEHVNLINKQNLDNLGVSFRSIDGDMVNLSSGWKTDNRFDVGVFTSQKPINYY